MNGGAVSAHFEHDRGPTADVRAHVEDDELTTDALAHKFHRMKFAAIGEHARAADALSVGAQRAESLGDACDRGVADPNKCLGDAPIGLNTRARKHWRDCMDQGRYGSSPPYRTGRATCGYERAAGTDGQPRMRPRAANHS